MQKKSKKSIIALGVVIAVTAVIIAIVVLSLNSTDRRVRRHLDLGYKYLEEMDYDDAIVEFKKAIALDPTNIDAYLGLAKGYMGNGDKDNALAILKDVIKIYNPSDDDNWNSLKDVTVRLADLQGVDATRQDIDKLINQLVQAGKSDKAEELQKELENYKGPSNGLAGNDGVAGTDGVGDANATDKEDATGDSSDDSNGDSQNTADGSGQSTQEGSSGNGPKPVDMGGGWLIYTQLIVGDNPSQFEYLSTDLHILEDGSEIYIGLLKNSTETAGQINFDSKPEYLSHPYVKLSSFSYNGVMYEFSVEGADSK